MRRKVQQTLRPVTLFYADYIKNSKYVKEEFLCLTVVEKVINKIKMVLADLANKSSM